PPADDRAARGPRLPPLPGSAVDRGRRTRRRPPRHGEVPAPPRHRRHAGERGSGRAIDHDLEGATGMTASRDPDRLIAAYLEDGPTELARDSYLAVDETVQRTRQRTGIGPRRTRSMN